jgi:hypothetical protein
MPGQRHKRFLDRQQFVDEMLAAVRANPGAVTQAGLAQALGLSARQLSRELKAFAVPWPPNGRQSWHELAQRAAQSPPADAWLITCRVTAATLGDAAAKLRAEDGVFIIEAKRLESASVPASSWRVLLSDKP